MFCMELKNARIIAGLTKPAAAALVGCPLRTYEDWEAGRRTPADYTQSNALDALRGIEPMGGLSPAVVPSDQPDLSGLRHSIGAVYDSSCWEPMTGLLWKAGTPFQLWKFERDVVYDGETWRVIIIEKHVMDVDYTEAIDRAEDVYFEAWTI